MEWRYFGKLAKTVSIGKKEKADIKEDGNTMKTCAVESAAALITSRKRPIDRNISQ